MADNTQYSIESSAEEADQTAEKRPCLIMIKGDFLGQVYELDGGVTMIGRSDEVDLVVSDVSISRRHAMIVQRLEGFYVSDLGSTNGTFINREPVKTATLLKEGDKVQVGLVTFKFSFQDEDDTEYHLMLRNMAIRDGLTRIYNKRHFDEAVEKEFEYNRRNRAGLAIVLFDIDHFKQINDTWGHPAGDFVLKHLALLIEDEARGYDLFARYGGEEFVFMLRGACHDAAVALAERVRCVVEGHTFVYEDVELKVTISLGVCVWNGDDSYADAAELVASADRQLYRAKNAGRNQVAAAQPPAA